LHILNISFLKNFPQYTNEAPEDFGKLIYELVIGFRVGQEFHSQVLTGEALLPFPFTPEIFGQIFGEFAFSFLISIVCMILFS
jgi:hypothetical protein